MQAWGSLKSDLLIRDQFLKKRTQGKQLNLQAEAFPWPLEEFFPERMIL